jgi:hypothetical protein
MGGIPSNMTHDKPLKLFLNEKVDITSWETVLAALEANPTWSYLAYERDDDGKLTALSYRWDGPANEFCATMDWEDCLKKLQSDRSYVLAAHEHTNRLREHVDLHRKLWVDQHCIPQVNGRMGCVKGSAVLYQGPVTAALLTKRTVDLAFDNGRGHELLGFLENWIGRGWVQQEITARGLLMNLDAFEYFFEKGAASGDDRLRSGGESLCLLLRRMKGASEEPFADKVIRFYAVMEADFTVESDRDINIPDFSDVGYEAFSIGKAPEGYKLQPGIIVQADRVYMKDSNGANIGKWFKRMALYTK